MKVVWTRLALADLADARAYIADHSPAGADRTFERIAAALDALRRHPDIGRWGRVAGTRELVVAGTSFIVAYRIDAKKIQVLAFIHAARRWPDSL